MTQIDYRQSLSIGLLKGFTGLAIGHPFDVIKTRCQANLTNPSQAVRSLLKEKGFHGFYSGITVNGARILLKETLRPLTFLSVKREFKAYLPEKYKNTLLETSLMGLTIATIEMIYCPFEKLKVDFITNSDKQGSTYKNFYQKNREHLTVTLFRGAIPMYFQKALSWIVFLTTEAQLKRYQEDDSLLSNMKISLIAGWINTLIYMPPDTVKSHLQKHDAAAGMTITTAIREIYRKAGPKGFCLGWQIRLVHYFTQSFYFSLLEKFSGGRHDL